MPILSRKQSSADSKNEVIAMAEGVRVRVLLPVALALTLLLIAFIYAFYSAEKTTQEQNAQHSAEEARSYFAQELRASSSIMNSTLAVLMGDRQLRHAFETRDRKALLSQGKPLLATLKHEHRITHLYFHLPNGVNLLRVHKPAKSGDVINRFTLREAQRTGKTATGVERGPLGIFVQRVVKPWYNNGQLIGYIELGKEFGDIADNMHNMLKGDILIAVDKKFLKKQQWEEERKHSKSKVPWNQFPHLVVMEKTTPNIPEDLVHYLSGPVNFDSKNGFKILSNGRVIQVSLVPLKDARNHTLGQLIRSDDITAMAESAKTSVTMVSLACLLIGSMLLVFFYSFLGRVEGELLQRTNSLRAANLSLSQEILEREKVQAQLLQAKEMAEEASRAKTDFLSRVSHELRTPLNAILGFGQLLEIEKLSERQRESVGHILKAGHHLLNLINEVLDIARVESGFMTLSLEPIEVNQIVAQSLDLVRPLAAQKNVQIKSEQSDLLEDYILADQQRLKQVMLNLLSNAVKYNKEEGIVELHCQLQPDDRLRINITDTGKGIAPEDVGRLFTPFERLDAEHYGVEGTGLGLALSRSLTEAMKGTLGVESVLGEGSTFYVEFNRAQSPLKALENLKNTRSWEEVVVHTTHRTVLYIEDNLSNYKLIETVLETRPEVQLVGAAQGSLGFELAVQHQPDLILLDLHLPDIDGQEVLRRLREDPKTSDIPVVVLSADATANQISRLLNAGVTAYLTKPLDITQFLQVLDETLQLTGITA